MFKLVIQNGRKIRTIRGSIEALLKRARIELERDDNTIIEIKKEMR